jgi:tetratricopeptide (TPR) repeat protein
MAVSSKKDKLVEEAQKFVLRGQFDKAAKVYEQILALEPASINLRQKLAELLIKSGRIDDARKELETIGKNFSKNGFYLKAIAVYKQLQKLFPADITISMTLAELNEKHGLVANSLSEYKLVYEYHVIAGNTPESLNILDKMQNVDPSSIPIKIKLAEAYVQNEKKDEAFAVFAKTVSLLLERGDNATLSKVCARMHQIFPDRPDFMFEILSEQISEGNAASAIDSIQSLLRSDPNNKRAWDLIVNAYQALNQHQRVKIAYQHYLKYFPSEPVAMLGLITSLSAEHNLTGALELLDQFEATLISSGFLTQLEQTYHTLDKIDPINIRVLQGLIRVATAAGKEGEVQSLTSKLKSLSSVSGSVQNDSTYQESPSGIIDEQSEGADITAFSSFFDDTSSDQTTFPEFGTPDSELSSETAPATEISDTTADTFRQTEEDIEIDIEIDLDSPFGILDQETVEASAHDNWLDSVGDLFDSINTTPRGVKFGNGMENSDTQTHYDLGQAFKEMGLFDEAINEFRQASQDPTRRVECLIMLCACLRERGEVEKAIAMLLALLKTGLGIDESCAVKYELASGYEATENKEGANILLNEIYTANPGFRDIRSRLNAAKKTESLDFSDDDLLNF